MADKFEKVTKNKKKVEQPSHKLTDPAVVDVLYSANLAEDLQKENQEPSTSSDQTPEQPLPKYTRSEILPRIAVSQRWHPELNANYSKICCQAHLNVDENGKKIPTSKMDLSVVHQRCGAKDYDDFLNGGNGWKACKNCEPDRFYVPRRPSQDEYEKRVAKFNKQKKKEPPKPIKFVKQDSDFRNDDEFDLIQEYDE